MAELSATEREVLDWIAGERATGPGSFAAAIIDALYALDERVLKEKAHVR